MDSETLFLTEAVYSEIIAHAREGKPEEVCGILWGRGARAYGLIRGRNIALDPIKDYEVDTQTLLRQFDFEENGEEMVAIYHSHPVSPAYPSASDAWSAHYPDCAYIICSLKDDEVPILRAFRLTPHDVPLELTALRAALDWEETRPGRFGYYQAADKPIHAVLRIPCAQVPAPFYIVFESFGKEGKNSVTRVVSILEYRIEIVRD